MNKVLAALKWLPAAACVLIAAAWGASYFSDVRILLPWPGGGVGVTSFHHGSAVLFHDPNDTLQHVLVLRGDLGRRPAGWLGEFRYASDPGSLSMTWLISCPVTLVLTLLLPVAVGSLVRFRFPLWLWFAWTALIAVQCAYFLPLSTPRAAALPARPAISPSVAAPR